MFAGFERSADEKMLHKVFCDGRACHTIATIHCMMTASSSQVPGPLFPYQDYHMLSFSRSKLRQAPLFRTRITTCCCSPSQAEPKSKEVQRRFYFLLASLNMDMPEPNKVTG